MKFLAALLLSLPLLLPAHEVKSLKVRILSTMLTDTTGFGEWGFAALVEADGRRILFDTGAHPDTVLRNLAALRLDLSDVHEVILSHHHTDHTAGLLTLREHFAKKNPKALQTTHVAPGIFLDRVGLSNQRDPTSMPSIKPVYEKLGGRFIEHAAPKEIHPGIWLTGPIPRKYPERNWSGANKIRTATGQIEDTLPEDMTLVIETAKGLVVIAGCSHAGIVNILDYARAKIKSAPIHAIIGGFHLFAATEETLAWTATKFKEFGLQNLLGAHCTGIEAVYRLRALTGLTRQTAAVGALGGGFDLTKGLDPGVIAR